MNRWIADHLGLLLFVATFAGVCLRNTPPCQWLLNRLAGVALYIIIRVDYWYRRRK